VSCKYLNLIAIEANTVNPKSPLDIRIPSHIHTDLKSLHPMKSHDLITRLGPGTLCAYCYPAPCYHHFIERDPCLFPGLVCFEVSDSHVDLIGILRMGRFYAHGCVKSFCRSDIKFNSVIEAQIPFLSILNVRIHWSLPRHKVEIES